MLTLHTTKEPLKINHVYHACHDNNCSVCDGGLALCVVCGGAEGSLLDYCPGQRLTHEQDNWNYYYGYKSRMKQYGRKNGPRNFRKFRRGNDVPEC